MTGKVASTGRKGLVFEETLKNYFLQAGFYVLRGIPFHVEEIELSDIDLWLYERPTGSARRRTIVDAKSKNKPKAAERLVWTHGLKAILKVDEAYVATTDQRSQLRNIARTLGIHLIDGNDVSRIQGSSKIEMPNRLTDEDLNAKIASVDRDHRNKALSAALVELKSSVVNLGGGAAVKAIERFRQFAAAAATSHPNSLNAEVAVRLAYLSASIVAISLDYIGAGAAFRSSDERRQIFTNAIRYGNSDGAVGIPQLDIAVGLVRRNVVNGAAVATQLEDHLKTRFESIPAEIVSEFVTRTGPGEGMFNIARSLEAAAASRILSGFDTLDDNVKGFVAVLLDFCGINRADFANSYSSGGKQATIAIPSGSSEPVQASPLISEQMPLIIEGGSLKGSQKKEHRTKKTSRKR